MPANVISTPVSINVESNPPMKFFKRFRELIFVAIFDPNFYSPKRYVILPALSEMKDNTLANVPFE